MTTWTLQDTIHRAWERMHKIASMFPDPSIPEGVWAEALQGMLEEYRNHLTFMKDKIYYEKRLRRDLSNEP